MSYITKMVDNEENRISPIFIYGKEWSLTQLRAQKETSEKAPKCIHAVNSRTLLEMATQSQVYVILNKCWDGGCKDESLRGTGSL